MYINAGRAFGVPVAMEVPRSGVGMHAWAFFTGPVPAQTARRLGTGLLREAMAIRGKVNLASYDRLFPSQDLLPAGSQVSRLAAPVSTKIRPEAATVVRARLGAGIRVELPDLTPALAASLLAGEPHPLALTAAIETIKGKAAHAGPPPISDAQRLKQALAMRGRAA